MQMIVRHPSHPSHLCKDPDSISRTLLEQFVLVGNMSVDHPPPPFTSWFLNPIDQKKVTPFLFYDKIEHMNETCYVDEVLSTHI